MKRTFIRSLLGILGFSIILGPCQISTAGQVGSDPSLQVIAVPCNPSDPSAPHPAYNGRPTVFKAIARGLPGPQTVWCRWDFADSSPRTVWYAQNAASITAVHTYPETSIPRMYVAILEVSASDPGPFGNPTSSKVATYLVQVYPDLPLKTEAELATDAQLVIMKEAGREDSLWLLHDQMVRQGSGAQIRGYLPAAVGSTTRCMISSILYLLALLDSGHVPAYPPGTYDAQGMAVPSGFSAANDDRWDSDPYAEDGIRLINDVLQNLSVQGPASVDDEGDDGGVAITGTNDGLYLTVSDNLSETNLTCFLAMALAKSGLGGTVAQVENPLVRGKTLEYVVQQVVDFAASSQDIEGGWNGRPSSPSYPSVSYQTGGWCVALRAIEEAMGPQGVHVNSRLKSRLPSALTALQAEDGGALYSTGFYDPRSLFEPTALVLSGCRWLEWDHWDAADPENAGYPDVPAFTKGEARQVADAYLDNIRRRWNGVGGTGDIADFDRCLWVDGDPASDSPSNIWFYSLFNAKAGADGEITMFGEHAWFRDFCIALIKSQIPAVWVSALPQINSYYPGPDHWLDGTANGILWKTAAAAYILCGDHFAADSPNHLPAALDQSLRVDAEAPLPITLEASDEDGDPLSYEVVEPPAHGTLSGTPPEVTYLPSLDYAGPDRFGFRAFDGQDYSATAYVTITVSPVNHVPQAAGQTLATDQDTPLSIALIAIDEDADALTYTILSGPLHGMLSGGGAERSYTPEPGYFGPDSFTFKASDGQAESDPAEISIFINHVNHPPVASNQRLTTGENMSIGLALSASDADGDVLTFVLVGAPAHGALSGSAPNLTYTPASGYTGPDDFTFKVSDGSAESNVATVSITIEKAGYDFSGFFAPVDNLPVVNSSKAGQTIPIKWRVTDKGGNPVDDPNCFAGIGSYVVSCSSLSEAPKSEVEEFASGASGLQSLGDGFWQFNWKTSKAYAGTCRILVLTLADQSSHTASFSFK